MKRIFALLLLAVSATSCDTAKDLLGFGDNTEYVGTLSISKGGVEISETADKTFRVNIDDNKIEIDMVDVELIEELPKMTLTIKDVDLNGEDFYAAEISPLLVVAPVENLIFSDVEGSVDASDMDMSFTCTYSSKLLDTSISVDVEFDGEVKN